MAHSAPSTLGRGVSAVLAVLRTRWRGGVRPESWAEPVASELAVASVESVVSGAVAASAVRVASVVVALAAERA
jgi:hypothetical protein